MIGFVTFLYQPTVYEGEQLQATNSIILYVVMKMPFKLRIKKL